MTDLKGILKVFFCVHELSVLRVLGFNSIIFFLYIYSKYERTKQMAMDLKEREAMLVAEKRILEESLKMQEQRYEKMKNHAVQQLER